jgi:hypothetical protein
VSGNSGTGGVYNRAILRRQMAAIRARLQEPTGVQRAEDLHDLRRLVQMYPEKAAQFLAEVRTDGQAGSSATDGRGSVDR